MPRYFMQVLLESSLMTCVVLSKKEVIVKGSISGIRVRYTLSSSWNFYSMMLSSHLLISTLPLDVKSKCS